MLVIVVGALIWAINSGLKKQDKVDCYQWQGWEQQGYKGFQPSSSMIAQCNAYGINLAR